MGPFKNLKNKIFFWQILKSSDGMYESSGLHFFRTTTGMQSRPDTFDKSRLFMTFLSNFALTWILCFFRLVLERKTVKVIHKLSKLSSKRGFFLNNFVLLQAEGNTSGLSTRWDLADLPLFRTILAIHENSWEPGFWEKIDFVALASLAASRIL